MKEKIINILTGPQKLTIIKIHIVANIIQKLFTIQYNLNLYIKYIKEPPEPFIIYYFKKIN